MSWQSDFLPTAAKTVSVGRDFVARNQCDLPLAIQTRQVAAVLLKKQVQPTMNRR